VHMRVSNLITPVMALFFATTLSSQAGTPAASAKASLAALATQNQVSTARSTSDTAEGLIKLDVVVTDESGKPVSGLEAKDFTLLDNGEPNKILSFQAFDGVSAKPDPSVEVILVIDTLGLPARLASYEREEVERFLKQNGGHLAQTVSIFGLADNGLWTVPQISSDGNVLAAEIAQNKQLPLVRRTLSSQRGEPLGSFAFEDPPGLSALKALFDIATEEVRKPGRKAMVWVGPGWGIGSGVRFASSLDRQFLFDEIHWFSTLLRETRIALYSFSVGEVDRFDLTMDSPITPRAKLFEAYLKGVKSSKEASIDALDRKVLAVQSGGRVLAPSDDLRTDILHTGLTDSVPAFDLVSQINSCVEEAGAFYTLSFNPARTDRSDEYHDLKVQITKPGLTARTSMGYYDEPYFYDQPHPVARRVTVAQFEQALTESRGSRDEKLAKQLSEFELTERLSDAKLTSLQAVVRGAKANAALVALADTSEFLDPPASEMPADAPPDISEQGSMIALAIDYLNKTLPRLPNFFATRTTIRYEETPEHYDQAGRSKIDYQSLHWTDASSATVLYRSGTEIVDSGAEKPKKPKVEEAGLTTEGTFGPILGAVGDAIAAPEGLTWKRWERGANGLRAVFRYAVPENRSRFQVGFCCLLDSDGTTSFQMLAGYHGEIAIDPESGAVLRLTVEADLEPTLPLNRSGLMVEYGPVKIGGKTYVCPLRSVSISRSRTIKTLTGFSQGFRTYGPYSTMLNDVAFTDYHMFRSETRILTGVDPGAEK
jgi:VWFA-related protein